MGKKKNSKQLHSLTQELTSVHICQMYLLSGDSVCVMMAGSAGIFLCIRPRHLPSATLSSVTDTHEISVSQYTIRRQVTKALKSQTSLLAHHHCSNSSLTHMHMQALICAHTCAHPTHLHLQSVGCCRSFKNEKQTNNKKKPCLSYHRKEEHFSVQE